MNVTLMMEKLKCSIHSSIYRIISHTLLPRIVKVVMVEIIEEFKMYISFRIIMLKIHKSINFKMKIRDINLKSIINLI